MLDSLLRQALLLIQPIGLAWLLLIILTVICWRRRQRLAAWACGFLVVLFTLMGSTDFPGWLLRRLELPWAGFRPADLPVCDAIVILGGGTEPSRFEAGQVHLTRAGDRLHMGMELARLGKAPVMVFGGGEARFAEETKLEADLVRDWMRAWKPDSELISLGGCLHTRDEGMKVAALAKERGWKHVALVTSANHMTRALSVFRKAGVEALPAPCNFLTTVSTAPAPFRVSIPSWQGFEKLSIWMYETAGAAIYRRRGWME